MGSSDQVEQQQGGRHASLSGCRQDAGVRTYFCDACGYVASRDIPPLRCISDGALRPLDGNRRH